MFSRKPGCSTMVDLDRKWFAFLRYCIITLIIVHLFSFTSLAVASHCEVRQPVSLLLAIDLSDSMREMVGGVTKIQRARDFAIEVVRGIQGTDVLDETAILGFCSGTAITPWRDADSTVRYLSGPLATCGATALYSAIDVSSRELRTRASGNLKYLVLLTDGVDSTGADMSIAISALSGGDIRSKLVSIGSGYSQLYSIASGAGLDFHEAIDSNPSGLTSIVNGVVDGTCINYHPNAAIGLSDSDLSLGIEGFNITFNGRSSSDRETLTASLNYRWAITHLASGTVFNGTGIEYTQTFDDSLLPDVNWRAQLWVTDGRGSTDSRTRDFTVHGNPPQIMFSGDGIKEVGDTLEIVTTPTEDIDGGGRYDFNWQLTSAPATASLTVGQTWNGTERAPVPGLVTTEADITLLSDGTTRLRDAWTFHLRATDNEGETADADAMVEVRNRPPEINLLGRLEEIDVGEAITYINDVAGDVDGGSLRYEWRVIQKPRRSSWALGATAETTNTFLFTTTANEAGSWIFRLNVTDNEGETVTETINLLVDAMPQAVINGPERIGAITGTLRLNAFDSIDPDSPCPSVADGCHDNEEGPVSALSPGIVDYHWSVIDIPTEWLTEYSTGDVDEILGATQGSVELIVDPNTLKPGTWVFQLQVTDGEGNTDFDTHTVDVYEENGPPFAIVSPPQRVATLPDGTLADSIIIDGALSYDLDTALTTGTFGPGVGIARYDWTHFLAPPRCASVIFPSGPTRTSALLHARGVVVPRNCLGWHMVMLTVTDDDRPTPRMASAASSIIITNCSDGLCIDSPKTVSPEHVEFTDATDVLIRYHLDASVYDEVFFNNGLYVGVEIFHESDRTTPVYSTKDPNVLDTNRGADLVYHWNGKYRDDVTPIQGRYDVRLTLRNDLMGLSPLSAVELNSIFIATAKINLLPETDKFVFYDKLADTTASHTFAARYAVVGLANPERLVYRVYDESDAVVFRSAPITAGRVGDIHWNGRLSSGDVISPGNYTFEIEPRREGASMGRSHRFPFKVLRLDIDVDTDRDAMIHDVNDEADENAWTDAKGAIFNVNLDRDGGLTTVAGARPVSDTVYFDDSGAPSEEDFEINGADDVRDITPFAIRGLGTSPPPGMQFFLKAGSTEDIQSIHVFKTIADGETAFWGALGNRVAGGSATPREIEITNFINVNHADFVGTAGDANSEMLFGLEGLFFRNLSGRNHFDGEIDLILEARVTNAGVTTVVFSDSVRLKVAPWMLIDHTQPSSELWAGDYSPWNQDFLHTSGGAGGYVGLDDSGQLRKVPNSTHTSASFRGSQWFQDHVETGFYQRPGGVKTLCTYRHPYRSQPIWPRTELFRPDAALFQFGNIWGNDTGLASAIAGSFGGNLELLPPVPGYPNGRIVIGDSRADEFWQFLQAQEVQAPFEVPTRWLSVSHVDEAFGFTGNGTDVIIADPRLAYSLLESIPAVDRPGTVLFAKNTARRSGVTSANSVAGNRLETGMNLTGTAWRYVRIVDGSGAAGQVARITPRNGYLEVHEVWDTSSRVVDAIGGAGSIYDLMTTSGGVNLLDSNANRHYQLTWLRLPQAGDRYVLVEDTQFWVNGDNVEFPAVISVQELLADSHLRRLNRELAHNRLNVIRTNITAAAGASVNFHAVPVLYFGALSGFNTGRSAIAMTPNMANFQVAGGKFYFPRQYGAVDAAGADIFENYGRGLFANARYVDDWDTYHRKEGEVHCGTSTVKRIPGRNWWTP